MWKRFPKVVFLRTLTSVQGNARFATSSIADEIERLRAEPGYGDIAIGGATLTGEATGLGLVDEYRILVYPVLVGGGISLFLGTSVMSASSSSRTAPSIRSCSLCTV